MRRLLLPVILISLACALPVEGRVLEQPPQDHIEMVGPGSLSNVRIIADTWIKVEAQRFQVTTPIQAYKVKKVTYAAAPELYGRAQKAAEEEDYEKALKALIFALEKYGDKLPLFKQYLLYDIARFYVKHAGEGDYEKAREYLNRLTNEIPDSRFIPNALLLYADTYFLQGQDFEAAKKSYEAAFQKLTTMSRQVSGEHIDYLQEKAFLARYKSAECLVLLKHYGEAKSVFEAIAARSGKYPRVRFLALLGKAQSLWQEKQLDEALSAFSKLIEDAEVVGIRDILAGAYAGLGDCYFEEKEYEEARWNYLKVAVQFFDAGEYVAKSLYRVGLCYKEIMLKEQNVKKRAEAKKQATHYFNETISDYKGFWADKAREALETL